MGILDLLSSIPQGLAEGASGFNNMSALDNLLMSSRPSLTEQPKGMFGIHGTGRDLLGILGDSLLVANGHDRFYKPGTDQEEAARIMQGYATDPQGSIARLNEVAPELSQKYQVAYDKNQYDAAKDAPEREGKFAVTAGGILGSSNERTYPAILEGLRKRAAANNIPDYVLANLPDKYDKDAVDSWVEGTLTAKEQADKKYRIARSEDFDLDRAQRGEHYRNTEDISRTNAKTSQGRLSVSETNAGKPKKTGSYQGDDNYIYTEWDDGTTTKSAVKAVPKGSSTRRGTPGSTPAPSASKPPPPRKVGDRIKGPNGEILTSRDGKTWSK